MCKYILVFISLNFIKNFIIFGHATKDSSPDFTDLNQKRKKDEKSKINFFTKHSLLSEPKFQDKEFTVLFNLRPKINH